MSICLVREQRSPETSINEARTFVLYIHIKNRGRYRKLHVHDRLRKYCPINAVVNETHFISQCPHYEAERNRLYQNVASISPSFNHLGDQQKTTILLKSQSPFFLQKVGQFINHCLQRRSQALQLY